MTHYLMKYKGKYRILPELTLDTHDFPRDANGNIDQDWDDIYIACQYGCKIKTYDSRKGILSVYIPSLQRGRNITKKLDALGINYFDYEETDIEVLFNFKSKDIDIVAELLKAKTAGADISPFSPRNLPKSDVEIPLENIKEYKAAIACIGKADILVIHRLTTKFLDDILQKRQRKTDKTFNYKTDMKKKCMSRQVKEYIWTMGFWTDYLNYLTKEIKKYYENK